MLVRAHNSTDAAILQAAADGNVVVLQHYQLSNVELICNAICSSGCTALHWAAGMNQVNVIRYILNLPRSKESSSSESEETAAATFESTFMFHVDFPIAKKHKAAGRTALHYAARNGAIEAIKCLIEEFHANPDAKAKHGVTPLHLAFFQNQKEVAEYLLRLESRVDLFQTNDYGCNVLHWLAICPAVRAGPEGGTHLVPTAHWLAEVQQQKKKSCNQSKTASNLVDLFHTKQTQGHTALHKAAWLGHYALIRYLHEYHDLWDDSPDHSGNYAVTLAEMARHDDNDSTVNYLRMFCSRSAAYSCSILGVSIDDINNPLRIRRAYHTMALMHHPDRQTTKKQGDSQHNDGNDLKTDNHTENDDTTLSFDDIHRAYRHLMYDKGRGLECNDAHKLKILLPSSENACFTVDDDCFKTRLLVVLKEYGSKGIDLSNLKKKWKQVWQTNFPKTRNNIPLARWIQEMAEDVVEIRTVNQCHLLYAKS